jgi:hypothetical protein
VCLRWLTEEKIIRDSVKNKVSKLNKIKIRWTLDLWNTQDAS